MGKKEKKKTKKKNKALKSRHLDAGKAGAEAKRRGTTGEKMSDIRREFKDKIKRLKLELQERDKLIEELQRRNSSLSPGEKDESGKRFLKAAKPGQVIRQRKAWEQHRYLRSQYELHLDSGCVKGQARLLADRDLRASFGEDAGYSKEQLEAILS